MAAQTPTEAGLAILEQAGNAAALARSLVRQAADLLPEHVQDQKVSMVHRHARLPAERVLGDSLATLEMVARDIDTVYSTLDAEEPI